MKTEALAITILFSTIILFSSCKKEPTPELFDIPLTNWNLTKDQVLIQEIRTLIENTSASEIVYLGYPYVDKGDGSLKYSDNKYFKEINYGFYNANNTLEVVICVYNKTNIKTTDAALQFLNSTYGEYTTRIKAPDYSNFEGKVYQFNASFGIVVLEEYSQTINRITFTKSQYSGQL